MFTTESTFVLKPFIMTRSNFNNTDDQWYNIPMYCFEWLVDACPYDAQFGYDGGRDYVMHELKLLMSDFISSAFENTECDSVRFTASDDKIYFDLCWDPNGSATSFVASIRTGRFM